MRHDVIRNLADTTEFCLAIQARPPKIVHGTFVVLTALLGAAFLWATVTTAALVVRAAGRVRPATSPMRVVSGGSGEVLSASTSGRVVAVHFREGESVRQGAVLIELDTQRLDNEMARQQRVLQVEEEELAHLYHLETLLEQQFASTMAKSNAELSQAQEEIRQAQERQAADVRLATLELENVTYEETQARQLVERGLVARDQARKAVARRTEVQERLNKARLPVEQSRVTVLRRAVDLAEREYAIKKQDIAVRQGGKKGAIEAARLTLANLALERQQALIRAPLDGVITSEEVKVGDVLERGKPVVEIAAQQDLRFEAAVPSAEVSQLRVGMPARLKLDAYDYQRYGTLAGTVAFIAPDSGVPVGQSIATYLVKIQLNSDILGRGEYQGQVKLGMAGQVEIVTGQERLLTLLVKKIRQTISLG